MATRIAGQSAERADSASGSWLIAFSAGVPGSGSDAVPELMTVGLQWTRVRPYRLGGDFALGTMPVAIGHGAAVVGVRAGAALAVPVRPGLLLLPSGGISGLLGVSMSGGGGLLGANAGLAAVATGESGLGVRVGTTVHRFADLRGTVWLLEMGMVARRGR